jgi:hypothetical protein
MTWDGRDVWRDEDIDGYDESRDRLFYGAHPYDPRETRHVESYEHDTKRTCARCRSTMVDEDWYCNFCSAMASKTTVEATLRWLSEWRKQQEEAA